MNTLAIEPEIQEVLDEHGNKINNLETKVEILDVRLKNMENNLTDVKIIATRTENTFLTSYNSLLQGVSQILTNTSTNQTAISTNKMDNKTKIVIALISGMVAFFTAKYGLKLF